MGKVVAFPVRVAAKATATRIEILWSEAGSDLEGRAFSTWAEATAALAPVAMGHATGGYLKTAFRVTFSDGETYEGRIDLQSSEYDLARHVRQHCEFYAGTYQPAHMTAERYAEYRAAMEKTRPGIADEYGAFLAGHEIGDGPEPEGEAAPWAEILDGRGEQEAQAETPATAEAPEDIDRNRAIARIRAALKARSGKAWSVTGGRGTAWGWITVTAPPQRRQGGSMTDADRAELGRLLGLGAPVHHQGAMIAASYAYRVEYVDRAEGREPRAVGRPYWD